MLSDFQIDPVVRAALAEDAASGDITTTLLLDGVDPPCLGVLRAKEDLVAAGIQVARRVFEILDPGVEFAALAAEGQAVAAGAAVAEVRGRASVLLMGERTALNFLAHLSGIATLVRRYRDAMGDAGAKLLSTRKTLPGLRTLQKHAVAVGGGTVHRTGLHDGILLKNNHAEVAGGVGEAVRRVRERVSPTRSIEAEARSLEEMEEAIAAGADVVLLDNFDLDGLRAAVRQAAGRVRLEASGGVTLHNVGRIAATGVDAVSAGSLTHSAPCADMNMSLRVLPAEE